MSLARCSAAALQSLAKAGSAEIDLIRSSANRRSRLLSKSLSIWSSTDWSCALDIGVFLIVVSRGLEVLALLRRRDQRNGRMADVPGERTGKDSGGHEIVAPGLDHQRKQRQRQQHQDSRS